MTMRPATVEKGLELAPAQQEQLDALAASVGREQAIWLSGYFAGLAEMRGDRSREGANVALFPARVVPASVGTSPAPAQAGVALLYGSETGNCRQLAEDFAARLSGKGLAVRVSGMESYKPRQLPHEKILLLITSTHGDGEPPQAAKDFFDFVESQKASRLDGLRYAVLALGDSTYEKYCEAGKRLDRRLEELGAARLASRVDCDVDYDVPADQWMDDIIAAISSEAGADAVLALVPQTLSPSRYSKRNPFSATVIDNLVLSGRGSSKETRHVEISLAGSGLSYQPGDALGIVASNDQTIVENILALGGWSENTPVSIGGKDKTLGEALLRDFEVMTATPRFLEQWAARGDSSTLKELLAPGTDHERRRFLRHHHVADIMRAYPVPDFPAEDFLAGLRSMQPRLYSIASSPMAAPDEVHLTVSTVCYQLHGEDRTGLASGYLARKAQVGTTLPVYIEPNPRFRLPADEASIIMIGAGTGIAPYRAFLQEREARGALGKSWLFLGERNFRADFLYQTEWQAHLKSGLLTRMDVAFSRDRAVKRYVQHRLLDRAKELYAWLEEGAHLYVCGDAERLAPDVHAALLTIVRQEGGLDAEAAETYLENLRREQRYQRDVY